MNGKNIAGASVLMTSNTLIAGVDGYKNGNRATGDMGVTNA